MDYMKKASQMLAEWVQFALPDLYTCPDRPGLVCYGAGYNGWGMQTHQKALAAFTVAATNPDVVQLLPEHIRETLLDTCMKMLRFMLETHLEGSYTCLEGDRWGHTWISVLGTERTMHAVEELFCFMNETDKKLLENVFLSEADWLLDNYDICAAPDAKSGKNRPESNIWNGIFLHRVAAMYPDSPRSSDYREKGTGFLVNGISIPADKDSAIVYDGLAVSALYKGNNFYDTYALDHHEYLNIGYMVICLSNIAMYHFSCKKQKYAVPEALYHHAEALWQLIKTCIADDGRLIRVGGDSRVRYCYCQDYLLPALLLVQDQFGDTDAEHLKSLVVDLFYQEFSSNHDGSFLSDRCGRFKEISPIYYTRLESDKASVLSMLLNWNTMSNSGNKTIQLLTSWQAPSHGACISNSNNRFASWAFYGAEGMTGLCLPKRKGNYAEWKNNLAAEILGCGSLNDTNILSHKEMLFPGGFLVHGEAERTSKNFLAEQQKDEVSAVQQIVFAALPDDATTVVLQYAYTPGRIYLQSVKGINFNIPNDIFNGFSRQYFYEGGQLQTGKFSGEEEIFNLDSRWLNIAQEIGVIAGYHQENLCIYRPGTRQISIKKHTQKDNLYNEYTQNLSCDVICTKINTSSHWEDKSSVILDTSAIIIAGISAADTKKRAEEPGSLIQIKDTPFTRSVCVKGQDHKYYAVLHNLADTEQTISIQTEYQMESLCNAAIKDNCVNLSAKESAILVFNN